MVVGGSRLECESGAAGEQQGDQGRNVKAYATSAFVLGMMVGVFGLVAVQHTMAGETTPSVLKNSFTVNTAPVKNGVQPVSGIASASQQGVNVGRSSATMVQPVMEPFESSAFPSSDGSLCSRRDALARAAGVAAAVIGVPAFAAQTPMVKMGSDDGKLKFEPSSVTICKGDSVTWVLNTAGPHNVQFEEVPAGVDADAISKAELIENEGDTFTQTFTVAGSYTYYCAPHQGAGMVGELTVK